LKSPLGDGKDERLLALEMVIRSGMGDADFSRDLSQRDAEWAGLRLECEGGVDEGVAEIAVMVAASFGRGCGRHSLEGNLTVGN
jgi:hypothetical protein